MKEEKFEIFYIRHADTSSDYGNRSQCDVDLSPLGEKQILLLGERFRDKSFDAVFCSPLIRCVKTCAAVMNTLKDKPTVEIVPELIENGTIPGYRGVDLDLIHEYYSDAVLCKDKIIDFESNFTDEENDIRAKAIVEYFKKRFTYGQKIAVFCHGSLGNHFIPAAVEMGEGNYILSISHTSVSKIKYTPDGKQRISFLDDISHLRPIFENYEFEI